MMKYFYLVLLSSITLFLAGCSISHGTTVGLKVNPPQQSTNPKPKNENEMIDMLTKSIKAFETTVYFDMRDMQVPEKDIEIFAYNVFNKVTFKDNSLKYVYQFQPTYKKNKKLLQTVIKYMPFKQGIDETKVSPGTKKIKTYKDFIEITKSSLGHSETPIAILDKNMDVTTIQKVLLSNCGLGYFVYTMSPDATKLIATPVINHTVAESMAKCKQITDSTTAILARIIHPTMSEEEKFKAIYHFVTRAAYDFRIKPDRTKMPYDSNTPIGVFVHKLAVCGGYSETLNILANSAGIETYNITGSGGGEYHAWNKAKLNGTFHSFDSTWDRAREERQYRYYAKSDEEFKRSHKWDNSAFEALTATKE